MDNFSGKSIAGQWFGSYSYGPEYGLKLEGEQVIFSILVDEVFNNQFKGKCIELEGLGASTEVSKIEGFIENNFISFTKEYPTNYYIDEFGKEVIVETEINNQLSYKGHYDEETKTFSGSWEIWRNVVSFGDSTSVNIGNGSWEFSKDNDKYRI